MNPMISVKTAIFPTPFILLALLWATASAQETTETLARRITGPSPFTILQPVPKREVDGGTFGLRVDKSGGENQAAFAVALDFCRTNPGTVLRLPKGTYRIGEYKEGIEKEFQGLISFRDLSNFTFDGQGSTLLFQALSVFIYVSNVAQSRFQDFAVEWDHGREPTQSIVRVVDLDPAGNWLTLTWPLEKKGGYPFAKAPSGKPRWFKEIIQVEPERYEIVYAPVGIIGGWVFNENKVEVLGPNLVKLVTDSGHKYVGPNHLTRKGFAAGQTYLMRHHAYTAHGISITEAAHLSLSNVTIHTTLGHGITAWGNLHHWQVTHSRLVRSPSRPYGFSSASDGFHSGRSKGFFRFENNEWAQCGDDLMNYYNIFTRGVSEVSGNSMVRENTVGWRNPVTVGEEVEICNPGFEPTGWRGRITGFEYLKGDKCRLSFAEPVPAGLGADTVLFYPQWNPDQFVIRNNTFRDNRGNGVLCGAGNGLIENNQFLRNLYTAIGGGCLSGRWSEGKEVSNLIIRGNRVVGPDRAGRWKTPEAYGQFAAINLSAKTPAAFSTWPMIRDIAVLDNIFEGIPSGAIFFGGLTGALIRNNRVQNPLGAEGVSPDQALLFLAESTTVFLSNNLGAGNASPLPQWKSKGGEVSEVKNLDP